VHTTGKRCRLNSHKEGIVNQIITIDGPAGSGKSTVGRLLAKELDYLYLDTGAMYRAAALLAKRRSVDLREGKKLWEMCQELDLRFETVCGSSRLYVRDEDISAAIRTLEMDMLSSEISAIREVRMALTQFQRKMGEKERLVAEGRDMGTVVFPNAEYKFFLIASPDVRVERRYRERVGRGESVSKAELEKELKKRDRQDETRSVAPLVPAKDAIIIDTTSLSPEEVVERMLMRIRRGEGEKNRNLQSAG
jgi:cytidylate kinase